MTYKRLENESDEALIFRVAKDKDLIGTWQDVADILNPLLGTDYGESTFRKKYAAFKQMFEANRVLLVDSEAELQMIRDEQRRLEIEKIKFRDERNAWNQQNRTHARAEAKLDYLEESLSKMGRIEFPAHPSPAVINSDKSMLIMLSDFHIGATFNNFFGCYNTDVAEDRLNQLLEKIKEIYKRHNTYECYVVLCGDIISGNIHHSIQVTNRENVIDQIKKASELVASFCYELTLLFSMVTMISVDGNHSRLDDKERSLHDERADQLIPFCVSMALSHIDHFYYCEEANLDSGIALFMIQDKTYVAVHGDYDNFNKTGIQNLITMIRAIPHAVLMGHKHYCATDEVNGIKMVQGGSLCGSGDQFTVERRLSGKASQMICICGEEGIEAFYPVELE